MIQKIELCQENGKYGAERKEGREGIDIVIAVIKTIVVVANIENDDDKVKTGLKEIVEAVQLFTDNVIMGGHGGGGKHAACGTIYKPEWIAQVCVNLPMLVFFMAALGGLKKILAKRKKAGLAEAAKEAALKTFETIAKQLNTLEEEEAGGGSFCEGKNETKGLKFVRESHQYTKKKILSVIKNYLREEPIV